MLDLLPALGIELTRTLYDLDDPSTLLLADVEVLEVTAQILGRGAAPTPVEALPLVVSHWDAVDVFSQSTRLRFGHVLAGFTNRLDRLGLTTVGPTQLTAVVCEDFLRAPISGGSAEPSVATMHLRRSALRAMFSALRSLLLRTDDPTVGLTLPRRARTGTRPVSETERDLLRLSSVTRGWDRTLKPSVIALAEAGLWPAENAAVRIADLTNLKSDDPLVVRCTGSGHRRDRYVTLTPWGGLVVRRRATAMTAEGATGAARLTYGCRGGTANAGASVGMALRSVFVRAGLDDQADLAPKSLVQRAALDLWDPERQNIVEVANRLGVGLDRAAEIVEFRWVDEVDWDGATDEVTL